MDFIEPFQTLSGQSGNVTRKGQCKHTDSTETFDCIEKKYSKNSSQFHSATYYLKYLQTYAPGIGPHVYHTTDDAMYMEFLNCTTLRAYLHPLDLTKPDDRDKFRAAVSSVKTLLRTLSTLRLCHTDLHADNILVCRVDDRVDGAKIIDLDDMKFIPEGEDGRCNDTMKFIAYIKAVGRESIRRARSSDDSVLAFVNDVTAFVNDVAEFDTFHDPGNFHIRPGEEKEMTASDDEFLLIN